MSRQALDEHTLEIYLERFYDQIILVEGKKDYRALKALGFPRVYTIHETSVPLRQRAEQIITQVHKNEKVCILTDFDKKGKQLYHLLKSIFQQQGVKTDATLRVLLLKAGISHIEGLWSYVRK